MYVCAYILHAQKPEWDVKYPVLSLSLFPCDKVSPLSLELGWSQPPEFFCLYLPQFWVIIPCAATPTFWYKCWDLNSVLKLSQQALLPSSLPAPSFISLCHWEWKQNEAGTELTKPERGAQKKGGGGGAGSRKEEIWVCSESSVLLSWRQWQKAAFYRA